MKLYFVILVLGLLMGCNHSSEDEVYDYGAFQIALPKEPEDENLNSQDSYAAKIKFDSVVLYFDYGLYSPKMTMSPREYLDDKRWEEDEVFMVGATLVDFSKRKLIRYDSISESRFTAYYSVDGDSMSSKFSKHGSLLENYNMFLKGDTLKYSFDLPQQMLESEFYVLEEDSVFSRVFIAKNFSKYKSGKYILDRRSCSDQWNCYRQLSIWVNNYGGITRDELFKIMKSVRLKN